MTKKEIINFMNEKNFYPSKKMGQNFLLFNDYKQRIVNSIDIDEDTYVFEIGPGFGAITEFIYKKTKQLTVIEFDKRLFEFLSNKFKNEITLINADILKFDISGEIEKHKNKKIKVISNLPYSISSQVIINLLKTQKIDEMVLMVQTEMANRIISKPNSKKYNGYSVLLNILCDVEKLFDVPPSAFYPEPNVYSTVIRLKPKKNNSDLDIEKFEKFLKLLFSEKRKKIVNNLKKEYTLKTIQEVLNKFAIDENTRAEQLTSKQIIELFKEFTC